MGKLVKGGVAVIFVLSIVCLGVTIMLFAHKINERERADAMADYISKSSVALGIANSEQEVLLKLKDPAQRKSMLDQFKKGLDNTLTELGETKNSLAKVKEDLTNKIEEAKKLATDLQVEKKEKDRLQVELDKQIEKAQKLVEELEKEREKTKQIEQKLANISGELETLTAGKDEMVEKVRKLEEEKMALKKRLQEISATAEGSVPLEPIYVRAEKKVSGEVIAVNDTYNFVIVNVGSAEGLNKGDELIISRDKALVGKVRVEKLKDDMAVANIMPEWLQKPIKEGDDVNKF
ncbi:hypothetical protein M0R36_06055 [bacterium]|jgi:myosin heavy subunit|nr:hypothetical protein [bacterium]